MSEDKRSDTTDKQRKTGPDSGGITGKGFRKGDARINRTGRPKTFDALRAEAVKLAGEIIAARDSGGNVIAEASRIHTILLDWATSKDPRKQELFVSYAYGKVPSNDKLTSLNVDLASLTDEQLHRIASGEEPAHVIADSRRSRIDAEASDGDEASRRNPG